MCVNGCKIIVANQNVDNVWAAYISKKSWTRFNLLRSFKPSILFTHGISGRLTHITLRDSDNTPFQNGAMFSKKLETHHSYFVTKGPGTFHLSELEEIQ